MNFDRKTIRDFMQDVMRPRLFLNSKFNREAVLWYFKESYGLHSSMTLDDEIVFLNALYDYCENFISFNEDDYGNRDIHFYVDPVNRNVWNDVMNSIYQEA